MTKTGWILVVAMFPLLISNANAEGPNAGTLSKTVAETERAFADTMARRDFEAFKTFLSDDAIFFSGATPLRGKQQVANAWEGFFKEPAAPFSWEPEHVEVLESGTLAWSSGPVRNAEGNVVATFNSVWQLDESNQWRIVFDKGNDICNCP